MFFKIYYLKFKILDGLFRINDLLFFAFEAQQFENSKVQLMVYPNPTNHSIVIREQSIVKKLKYDVIGNLQMKFFVNTHYDGSSHAEERSISLNVSSLAKGIYLLKITAAKGKVSKANFIKE